MVFFLRFYYFFPKSLLSLLARNSAWFIFSNTSFFWRFLFFPGILFSSIFWSSFFPAFLEKIKPPFIFYLAFPLPPPKTPILGIFFPQDPFLRMKATSPTSPTWRRLVLFKLSFGLFFLNIGPIASRSNPLGA